MKERATMRIGKGHSSHNDRSKEESTKNVIHPELTHTNLVYFVDPVSEKLQKLPSGESLLDKELNFYRHHYMGSLERKNAHYRSKGNKRAIKTMEQYYEGHAPHEMVLQIGKKRSHTQDELKDEVGALIVRLKKENPNMKIISASFHNDEVAPHCHLRYVLEYETDYGDKVVDAAKALNEMGYEGEPFPEAQWRSEHPLDDPETPSGKKKMQSAERNWNRYHGAHIAFTDALRSSWYDILLQHGYNIETTTDPKNRSRRNMSTQEWKLNQTVEAYEKLDKELDEMGESYIRGKDAIAAQKREIDTLNATKAAQDARIAQDSSYDRQAMFDIIARHGLIDELKSASRQRSEQAAQRAQPQRHDHDDYE